MLSISVEKDGLYYEAEYFVNDNMVTIFGERGQCSVDIHGMTEQLAARTALRNLIREKKIEPKGE